MSNNHLRLYDEFTIDATVLSEISMSGHRISVETLSTTLMDLCNGANSERKFELPGSKIHCQLVPVTLPEPKLSHRVRIMGLQSSLKRRQWAYIFWDEANLAGDAQKITTLRHFGLDIPDDGGTWKIESLRPNPVFFVAARLQDEQIVDIAFDYSAKKDWTHANQLSFLMESVIQGLERQFVHTNRQLK